MKPHDTIKANLLHLGTNMWNDWDHPAAGHDGVHYRPYLRFDYSLWKDVTKGMAESGFNMVVIDLGDGVRYESHPEIAVKKAWSVDRLRRELERLRKLGLEPIPKLNFSSTHCTWLGPYYRMISTPKYYEVCRDLIDEVCAIFGNPRYFHLGMDEETWRVAQWHRFVVLRQHDLWWEDLYFLVNRVEKHGARAWMWADMGRDWPDVYFDKMPKSVLQSNWHYGPTISRKIPKVQLYLDLDKYGFDQVPGTSTHSAPDNALKTVKWARRYLTPERFKGILQTTWQHTVEKHREVHIQAIEQGAKAFALLGK
ncbi:Tat pathway signal protein [bacterium]|nr:Tat pathway signal protein [bacterium]